MAKLLTSDFNYLTKKVLTAASLAGINLEVDQNVSEESLLKIDPKAKSVLLLTASGALTQYNTILRYLGNVSKLSPLNGSSLFETAEVNQWLEFSWAELGVQ